MPDSLLNTETQGIGSLIHNRRYFKVPDHQREYAWTDEEVEQFFEDVIGALVNGAEDYFLGLIVLLQPDADRAWEILDGQQRLATATMLYAAIREWLYINGFEHDAASIQSDFIGTRELGQREDSPRLILNVSNRSAYSDLVVNRREDGYLFNKQNAAPRYSSDRLLIAAAITCRQQINKFAGESAENPEEKALLLYKLANYMRDQVKVAVLDVASTANAYIIFESLNDRGLDLSVLDLVKNHLFSRAGTRLPEVQSSWVRMLAHIGDHNADDFLKVFWTSRRGRVQRGKLFYEWRQLHDSMGESEAVELSESLAHAADQYSALEVPDHEAWNPHTTECRRYIRILALLGARQMWPVILAALDRFDAQRMERLLKVLVTVTIRYQTVGRRRTGQLEITSARAARGVFDRQLNSPMKVWQNYTQIVPTDEDFRADFSRFSEPKPDRARYMLEELERVHQTMDSIASQPEVGPQSESLTLEHIFPTNPSDEWAPELQADPDIRTGFVSRLGNLCLLGGSLNREARSHGFQKKREIYLGSEIKLTQAIALKHDNWNTEAIEERQGELADLAAAAWPLPY